MLKHESSTPRANLFDSPNVGSAIFALTKETHTRAGKAVVICIFSHRENSNSSPEWENFREGMS